jgi:hypothetical protein
MIIDLLSRQFSEPHYFAICLRLSLYTWRCGSSTMYRPCLLYQCCLFPTILLNQSLNTGMYYSPKISNREKGKKDKQRSTKYQYKTKDRVTRKIVLSHLPRNTFWIGPFVRCHCSKPTFLTWTHYVRSKWLDMGQRNTYTARAHFLLLSLVIRACVSS